MSAAACGCASRETPGERCGGRIALTNRSARVGGDGRAAGLPGRSRAAHVRRQAEAVGNGRLSGTAQQARQSHGDRLRLSRGAAASSGHDARSTVLRLQSLQQPPPQQGAELLGQAEPAGKAHHPIGGLGQKLHPPGGAGRGRRRQHHLKRTAQTVGLLQPQSRSQATSSPPVTKAALAKREPRRRAEQQQGRNGPAGTGAARSFQGSSVGRSMEYSILEHPLTSP
ncbi:hypothetical protein Cyagr_0782 [Cyanobium gracile PCC 6307]|uniref:Uncharacterized protein n=1 Tax=Cyanobium gracile (strain ATCC 27147 / PCC 6307) TaxID=292564 RepID=K9P5Y5_CYAGP|nr:hypothetical protein Cyagr_0782 [Cyanobium gracile PCC 6307]